MCSLTERKKVQDKFMNTSKRLTEVPLPLNRRRASLKRLVRCIRRKSGDSKMFHSKGEHVSETGHKKSVKLFSCQLYVNIWVSYH